MHKKQKHSYKNMYLWLSIYGIFISSMFLVKSLTMYLRHETVAQVQAQTLPESEKKLVVQTPAPHQKHEFSKKDYILSQNHGDILLRIWTNESSRGNSDGLAAYCSNREETNEFGYDPQDHYCFSSFTYAVQVVNRWFDTCLQDNSLEDCLLKYSGNSDSYVAKFLAQSNN